MLIVNCNYVVKIMYKAIEPFLSDMTKEKIKLFGTG